MRQYPGARGVPSTQRGQRSTCRPARCRPAALQRPQCEWAVCPCNLHALHRQPMFQGSAPPGRHPCNAPGQSQSAIDCHQHSEGIQCSPEGSVQPSGTCSQAEHLSPDAESFQCYSKKRLMDPLTFQNVNHPEQLQGKVIFLLLLVMSNSASSPKVSSAVTPWARFTLSATSVSYTRRRASRISVQAADSLLYYKQRIWRCAEQAYTFGVVEETLDDVQGCHRKAPHQQRILVYISVHAPPFHRTTNCALTRHLQSLKTTASSSSTRIARVSTGKQLDQCKKPGN